MGDAEIRKLLAGRRITASNNTITVTGNRPKWECNDNPGDIEDNLLGLFFS